MPFTLRNYRFLVILSVLMLTACSAPGHFPGATGRVLDADSEAEWLNKINYRSGKVVLLFEPVDQQCGARFNIHFADDKDSRLTHEVSLYLHGSPCTGQLHASAAHFDTSTTKVSSYSETPFPMLDVNKVEISWVRKKHLSIHINGEPLVQGQLGRNFHYMKMVAQSGAIRILELSHE